MIFLYQPAGKAESTVFGLIRIWASKVKAIAPNYFFARNKVRIARVIIIIIIFCGENRGFCGLESDACGMYGHVTSQHAARAGWKVDESSYVELVAKRTAASVMWRYFGLKLLDTEQREVQLLHHVVTRQTYISTAKSAD